MVKKALPQKRKVVKATKPEKILLFGSRYDLGNLPEKAHEKIKELHEQYPGFIPIVGKAPGMDSICEFVCKELGHKPKPFPAKWKDKDGNYNKNAGFERNLKMALVATRGVGFWNKESGGTMDTYRKLKKLGKPVELVKKDI